MNDFFDGNGVFSKVPVDFTAISFAQLQNYLESHEDDIALGINDFAELRKTFCVIMHRSPERC